MAQDYGAAQPIADWVGKYVATPVRSVLRTVDMLPDVPRRSVNDAWHDDMVRQANRIAAARSQAKSDTGSSGGSTPAAAPKRVPRRTTARPAVRPAARKRR